jgi:ABC-type lipoprotein export system ATPase subunit
MTIPSVDPQALRAAMKRFDETLLFTDEWKSWERQAIHIWAIEEGKHKYPIKKIIQLATNIPVESFSEAESILYLQARGFAVVRIDGKTLDALFKTVVDSYQTIKEKEALGGNHLIKEAFLGIRQMLEVSSQIKSKPNLKVVSSYGKGRWASIPWIALLDQRETNTVQGGAYLVYLFKENGEGLYFNFSQGVTLVEKQYGAHAHSVLKDRAAQARIFCKGLEAFGFELSGQTDLSTNAKLGTLYESATVAGRYYGRDNFPSEEAILTDLTHLLEAYDRYVTNRFPTVKPSKSDNFDAIKIYAMKSKPDDRADLTYPCVLLTKDNWIDYNISTLYKVFYLVERDKWEVLGDMKIMQSGYLSTSLPSEIEQLDDNFIGLGQDLDFYKRCKEVLGQSRAFDMLGRLNDACVVKAALRNKFEDDPVFITSMLRYSEAMQALAYGSLVLSGTLQREPNQLAFSYSSKFWQSLSAEPIEFSFDGDSKVPRRLNVLVGRNGVGKTTLLNDLALDVSGKRRPEEIGAGDFSPAPPIFSKLITISYSAFDEFSEQEDDERFSYKYCGLKSRSNLPATVSLMQGYEVAVEALLQKKRHLIPNLIHCLEDLVDESILNEVNKRLNLSPESALSELLQLYASLGSGQKVVLRTFFDLFAYAKPASLILIDEPELHMHPNSVEMWMKAFTRALDDLDSYAIIATHSPILLRDVLPDHIISIHREKGVLYISMPSHQTMGSNLTELTEFAFGSSERPPLFEELIDDLVNCGLGEAEIKNDFGGRLNLTLSVLIRNAMRRKNAN